MKTNKYNKSKTGKPKPKTVRIFVILMALGLIPILILGYYSYRVAALSIDSLIHTNNTAVATITSKLIEQEFEYQASILREVTNSPHFVEDMISHDEQAIRERLRFLVEVHPRIIRAFATDLN